MYKRVLIRMREKVRRREYVVTAHARKEMMMMTLQSTMLKEEFLQARYWNAKKTK